MPVLEQSGGRWCAGSRATKVPVCCALLHANAPCSLPGSLICAAAACSCCAAQGGTTLVYNPASALVRRTFGSSVRLRSSTRIDLTCCAPLLADVGSRSNGVTTSSRSKSGRATQTLLAWCVGSHAAQCFVSLSCAAPVRTTRIRACAAGSPSHAPCLSRVALYVAMLRRSGTKTPTTITCELPFCVLPASVISRKLPAAGCQLIRSLLTLVCRFYTDSTLNYRLIRKRVHLSCATKPAQ